MCSDARVGREMGPQGPEVEYCCKLGAQGPNPPPEAKYVPKATNISCCRGVFPQ